MNKEKLKGYLDKVKTALGKVSKKIWILIAVAVAAVIVGVGGVLIVVNPWGASMTFVLVLGAAFIANGAVDLFIEWYARDSAKQADLMARPR